MLLDYTTIHRVFSKIAPGPNGCWEWQAACANGYGHYTVNIRGHRSTMKVHRLMWTAINGPIPAGLFVCHACDNKRCCNPAHLWLGTTDDNMRDMVAKGRQAHPQGSKQGSAILSESDVARILELYATHTITQADIARMFGVSRVEVTRIVNRQIWVHVEVTGATQAALQTERINTSLGERNGRAKLTEQDVRQIRELSAVQRVSYTKLARQFGVDKTSISDIIRRRSWSHVE